MVNEGLQGYFAEQQAYLAQNREGLDTLHGKIKNTSLSTIEYLALERLLQLSIEAAIGLAKHWVKDVNKVAPNDAYQAFKMLKDYACIDNTQQVLWQKIIGMRNALVHDYLKIDETAVLAILESKEYLVIFDFTKKAILEMSKPIQNP